MAAASQSHMSARVDRARTQHWGPKQHCGLAVMTNRVSYEAICGAMHQWMHHACIHRHLNAALPGSCMD